jgi:hypothetical protein
VQDPQLSAEQIGWLESQFDAAAESADFQWDDTPKYIPKILAVNGAIRMVVSYDPTTNQKGLQFGPLTGETLTIENYKFNGSFCSVFYGISDAELDLFRNLEHVQKYKKDDVIWYFAAGVAYNNALNISLMFMLETDTACFMIANAENETELTDDLMQKITNDFSCVVF